ncbi:ABC transporter permease subunit [Arthrobacter sp. H20]|uniref:ABC transporter permease subunit n=1 Tax=Arthrobacter sp. H20 TaxID=1267981 RepID=UPI000684D261|nr:ABC transporter permease subunit [Arthrobacter sp. H20]
MTSPAQTTTRRTRTGPSTALPLVRRALLDHWRSTLAWAVGLAAAILVYLPLFPTLGNSAEMQDMIDALPAEMTRALNYDQITSGPGYTHGTIFGLIGFLLMTIDSVSWGASAVAGDEESGQLELTLAHAVTRPQVVLERALAIGVRIVALAAVVFVLVWFLNEPAQLQIQTGNLFGATVLFAGLALLSGMAALFAGAVSGRKIYGLAAGTGVAVISYVFNAVGRQSPDLQWLLNLSPYHWAYGNSPLANGADWSAAAWLWGIAAALAGLGAVALQRRDVGV